MLKMHGFITRGHEDAGGGAARADRFRQILRALLLAVDEDDRLATCSDTVYIRQQIVAIRMAAEGVEHDTFSAHRIHQSENFQLGRAVNNAAA